MSNIRKIITERLENASLDYRYWLSGVGFDGIIEPDFYKIEGQIEAYQDCLNLMQPRTEQDILNDFEKFGWEITTNDYYGFIFKNKRNEFLKIYNLSKTYRCECNLSIQEHKLLNELFEVIFDEC